MVSSWMVRSQGGEWFPYFEAEGCVVIDTWYLGKINFQEFGKEQIKAKLCARKNHPRTNARSAGIVASEILRFIYEIRPGDIVLTYNRRKRTYLVGKIEGRAVYVREHWDKVNRQGRIEGDHYFYFQKREVKWLFQFNRDDIKNESQKRLGSGTTVFKINPEVLKDIKRAPKVWLTKKTSSVFNRDVKNIAIEERIRKRKYGSGGEGEGHRRLKYYVKEHPEEFGIKNFAGVEIERVFITEDCADVVFNCIDKRGKESNTVVEIKTEGADAVRGVNQALKYRVLLCAEKRIPLNAANVKALLIAWSISKEVESLAKLYGIRCAVKPKGSY